MQVRSYEEEVSRWKKLMEKLEEQERAGIKVEIWPSPPDPRDFDLARLEKVAVRLPVKLPDVVVLHPSPIVMDQGGQPFCGGAAGASIGNAHYDNLDRMPDGGFSMRYTYWKSKEYDGIPDKPGTYLRTVCKVMQKYGLLPDALLPFEDVPDKPEITSEMDEKAKKYRVKAYARLWSLDEIKQALNDGFYVLIGTIVTSENWNTDDGFLSWPQGFILGGHATKLFGYDDRLKKHVHVGYLFGLNSWGKKWGDGGRFYMPYDYYEWESADMPGFKVFQEAWALEFEEVGPKPDPVEPDPKPDPVEPEPKPERPKLMVLLEKLIRWLVSLFRRK